MKYLLLLFFCASGLTASAQWWHKKHEVYPLIKPLADHSIKRLAAVNSKLNTPDVKVLNLGESKFSLQIAEANTLKLAKHNMRFRVYNEASYNFSDLALIYVQMHRLSEAKWYFLQSNNISRGENDDKHTISNLVNLAMVKTDIGDVQSAHADLVEARDLARARGLQVSVAEIEAKLQVMDRSVAVIVRPELKYAESTGSEKKAL